MPATNRKPKLSPVELDHPVNKKITFEQLIVTPGMAEAMLGANQQNRNLRHAKVAQYARDMTSGNWKITGEPIKFDWNGRLIDGQHRLHAVVESDVSVPLAIVRGLEPDAQTALDAGAKRSGADALRFKGHTAHASDLASIARIATAYESGELRSVYSSITTPLTATEILDWVAAHPEVEEAVNLARRVYRSIGGTPSAMGFSVFRLAEVDAEQAFEFFTSTAEYRTNGATDPRSTLIRTFARLKEQRVALTPALQVSLIFRAWNAWRGGKEITTLPLTKSLNGRAQGVGIPKPE